MINEKVLVISAKMFIICLTAALNGIIIFIFKFRIKRHTFSDYVYLSIGLSDFIIGVLSMSTQSILDQFQEWPFDKLTCFLSIFLQYAIPDTTVFALLVLAVHIYVQLTSRSKVVEKFTLSNIAKLALPWFVATLFWAIAIVFFVVTDRYSARTCNILPNFGFKITKVLLFGFLPIFLIISINVLSVRELKKKRQKLKSSINYKCSSGRLVVRRLSQSMPMSYTQSSTSLKLSLKAKSYMSCLPSVLALLKLESRRDRQMKRKSFQMSKKDFFETKRGRYKKVVFCILALTASIVLTQVVYQASWPFYNTIDCRLNSQVTVVVYEIGVWLSYLTSLVNPILVLIFNEKLKRNIKKIFRIYKDQ
ncbi:muscarinic acetylcholine receptor M1 [Brachionus plicatilis]|uniref:Muscarinic acetylcholine receptor M1 n=1 Tax=Brachionus plicatilis TaxID=10195 RepID=A0A3M7R3Y5_BRAPC|nr:muscarinic acetylcholine receptor M1 [Brachionus plicatilis]